MLAITTALKERLQALPSVSGWAVRAGGESGDRREFPAIDVRCSGASVSPQGAAAMLKPEWLVTIAVNRSATAADEIDAALSEVIESLHGWQPGSHGSRGWEQLNLQRVTEAIYTAEGLVGYELAFETAASYMGQQ